MKTIFAFLSALVTVLVLMPVASACYGGGGYARQQVVVQRQVQYAPVQVQRVQMVEQVYSAPVVQRVQVYEQQVQRVQQVQQVQQYQQVQQFAVQDCYPQQFQAVQAIQGYSSSAPVRVQINERRGLLGRVRSRSIRID